MANSKNCRSNEKGRILGIKNRTENWKTARYLSPFFDDGAIHLANRLMEGCTGGSENTCKGPVRLELYWKGMRDYINCKKPKPTCYDLADHYSKYFSCLREKIKKFNESKQFKHILRLPKEANNYTVAKVEDKKACITISGTRKLTSFSKLQIIYSLARQRTSPILEQTGSWFSSTSSFANM